MQLTPLARLLADAFRLWHSRDWDGERIAAYQRRHLLKMLRYAVANVPFYSALGLDGQAIHCVADLERFPVITKANVQERGREFLSREFSPSRLKHSKSSGMSGEPTVTYFDARCWWLTRYALKLRRVLSDTKLRRQRVLLVSEQPARRPQSPLLRLLSPVLAVRTLSLSADLAASLQELREFRPTLIYGFPSWLLALARAASEAGIALPSVPLVYTSSEVLTAATRRTLEAAYGARVVDIYGSTEFKEIAVQCVHGRYHVNFESVYVESVPRVEDGVPRLLVTTLMNEAMPLVRYDLGDTGRVEEGVCPCGRHGPYLLELAGRLSEVLAFPDGTRLSPYLLTTVIEQRETVHHFRIVHEGAWDLRIELFAPAWTAADERDLENSLKQVLPADVRLRFVALATRGTYAKRRAVSREF
ncbi:MAG: hypothetical protein ABI640_02365 [Gammaproteobacteria bacterium]